ncbi:UV DNA damage repair endonuclease UvsE [Chryseosolibacter indicus]|uniref:UV DNA damage repair endonuclease UvsE n=1 Tax=Chryseosolibacter indicus TaxID=2782351 RepID=A0ABS5VTM6_9BACT|nr:UV DNA damage repair endonuclease UvsE [Chryseosolibacter indicus]MBT1703336.1 UV DNA damage repair endonuclease UvsE [Chryseosolibacter indicus]
MRIGYACINISLSEKSIQVNRSMVKRTFESKGPSYASALALKNVSDLAKIIDWNIENGVLLYRLSSDMFPWMSEYELRDLPDFEAIAKILARSGEKAREYGLRLTFHPGQFDVLATNSDRVLNNTIKDLRQHGEIMDLMNLPRTPFAKINIHVGSAVSNKQDAIDRFCNNYLKLPESVKTRLTVENDDKVNMYSIKDLLAIHERIGIPIVFDYFHHQFCTGGLAEEEALKAAVNTWPKYITPIVHYSSSKRKYEDKNAANVAHADYIYQYMQRYNVDVDVVLEAKAKEKAVARYKKEYNVNLKKVMA